jgi:hypothetical protein
VALKEHRSRVELNEDNPSKAVKIIKIEKIIDGITVISIIKQINSK